MSKTQAQNAQRPALSIDLELSVRVGTGEISLEEISTLEPGRTILLRESAARPLELCANGHVVARGVLEDPEGDGSLSLKITEMTEPNR
ncbi:FliM/FliN family flagellar motor switch protein [Parvularcula sp. ZS-1/3]|uniref:FliM/FliN family flagellar motor switch protein n=1 Tax=Parvularcula mediterranea TaxID=2732508 RepID=A0A7Y3RNE1_9PROT|nr:FliM/FliN family flagellar motor C-terminal domain-containing protein [Parvularcula mediterranea]NNU17297.1 FliM/FliN family flagellar motor switch protein [Parvularcula mediterranea]